MLLLEQEVYSRRNWKYALAEREIVHVLVSHIG
jgi:hypothetical protein